MTKPSDWHMELVDRILILAAGIKNAQQQGKDCSLMKMQLKQLLAEERGGDNG